MPRRIPEIQEELRYLADEIELAPPWLRPKREVVADIRRCTRELSRRRPTTRAPVQSARMTPLLRAAILADHLRNPLDTFQQIAERHGVNAGRVSEVVSGKRK